MLRLGYNMIRRSGVALTPDQWDFTNNPPTSGTTLVVGGVFLHGVNLGPNPGGKGPSSQTHGRDDIRAGCDSRPTVFTAMIWYPESGAPFGSMISIFASGCVGVSLYKRF